MELFGAATGDDPLYEAVSAGQRYPGMEHWLPLFHEQLETLFDYVPDAPVSFDHLAEEAVGERLRADRASTTRRAWRGWKRSSFGAPPYKPVPPDRHVPRRPGVGPRRLKRPHRARMTPFEAEAESLTCRVLGGRLGRNFAAERAARRT